MYSLSWAGTRISVSTRFLSPVTRLMRAAPRGDAANSRSSAMTLGRRLTMASSARKGSTSRKSSSSPSDWFTRAFRRGSRSAAPTSTVHVCVIVSVRVTGLQYTIRRAMISGSYRDVTVGDLLTFLARALPRNDALVYVDGPRYTFAELEDESRRAARGLMALGVSSGERVVLWATNVPEWIVLQFALAKIGAILVTANTSLRAKEIDYLLRQSEAATLVTIRGFKDTDYVGALTEIGATAGRIPSLSRIIFIGDEPPAGFLPYGELRTRADRV